MRVGYSGLVRELRGSAGGKRINRCDLCRCVWVYCAGVPLSE